MPPLTKLEQSRAKGGRRQRIILYSYIFALLILWGACGLYWMKRSVSCAHTAQPVYRHRHALMRGHREMHVDARGITCGAPLCARTP